MYRSVYKKKKKKKEKEATLKNDGNLITVMLEVKCIEPLWHGIAYTKHAVKIRHCI